MKARAVRKTRRLVKLHAVKRDNFSKDGRSYFLKKKLDKIEKKKKLAQQSV
jgi:hypothetical protein